MFKPDKHAMYGYAECRLEGFPHMTPGQFVEMFCKSHACKPDQVVTRIQYEYLP